MRTAALTDTQQAILGLIAERIEAEGVPPSQTEIARAFGFSGVRAAQYHLEALEAAGAIERVPGRAPDYLLKVKGDSMIDEGIFEGDLIGVHRTPEARSGQIVVARVDDAITVKLLRVGKDRIRLLPRNPDHAPIEVLPDQGFAIEGLYCGLVRPNR
jgi:repressor LexA